MDSSCDGNHTHRASYHPAVTIYRTPSSHDAADTAAALTPYAALLDFRSPASVVQSRPGVYEVRVTYAEDAVGLEFKDSLAALNRILGKILLARLDKGSCVVHFSMPRQVPGHTSAGIHRAPVARASACVN